MESAHGKGALKQELLFRPIDIQRLAAKITGAVESTEEEPKPSYLLAIAALMELLTAPVEFPRPHGMNQEAIKGDILDKFPLRGLSDRNLEEIFARANKAVAKARARLE